MAEEVFTGAPGVLQCISQNRQSVKRAFFVNTLRQEKRIRRSPCHIEHHRSERVAEDVAKDNGLLYLLKAFLSSPIIKRYCHTVRCSCRFGCTFEVIPACNPSSGGCSVLGCFATECEHPN